MNQTGILKKGIIALSVVALTVTVGVTSASALSLSFFPSDFPFVNGNPFGSGFPFGSKGHPFGYAFSQCKDDGWKSFKNSDGSLKFKNQGQCIAFFIH